MTDQPFGCLPKSEEEDEEEAGEEDTLGAEPFGGDINGHHVWAFQLVDD